MHCSADAAAPTLPRTTYVNMTLIEIEFDPVEGTKDCMKSLARFFFGFPFLELPKPSLEKPGNFNQKSG